MSGAMRVETQAHPDDYGRAIRGTITPQGVVRWSDKGTPIPFTPKARREAPKR